ncbi:hypothetical protein GH714_004285 [Hevea brasiliensis]|uniref:Protein kinase domain-containing protein n=1 Tax=Hevea brasiliensis TaxID=3981 RepID=A0A6A6KJJ7_HEVBR|nr:hypothetical protein GH714_004285 [Hevea brasiliensis]
MDELSANEAQEFKASSLRWRPRQLAFEPYTSGSEHANKAETLRVVVRRPLLARLTKDIVETYQICNPQFRYSEELNPKRYLTSPSIGVLNDGYDNVNSDLILTVNFALVNLEAQRRYELIKINQFRGLSLSIVQLFSKQILHGLALLKDAGIIHCDLKPENILLCTRQQKLNRIDFGSACMEDRTVYSYIQSRYYRSPEVLLGYQYTTAIDMWSFGCIVAELFLGLPLFPGASEFDLLRRMVEILGRQKTSKFFKCVGSVHNVDGGEVTFGGKSAYQALTVEEYEARELKKPSIGKEYFHHMNIEAIVTNYPYRKNLPREDMMKESRVRLALIDFLRGLVEFDPAKRWSPFQASKHPFVTGEPFTCPYKPPPETPRMPVTQNFKVDHHPGGGHWFAADIRQDQSIPSNSPHFQVVPYAHGNSFGSVGSHGSYNDGIGLGSSYGSYGDSCNMFAYYSPAGPSGMNMHAKAGLSMLGSSPDARRRFIQYSHSNGIGTSPSTGNFAPLPLGTSPSQFTPPSSYNQVSTGSPGHYGPTSPARSNCHGSPLGKAAAVTQFNRRKSWGYSGSSHSQESVPSLHWQGQYADGTSSTLAEGNPSVFGSSPSHCQSNSSTASWMQQHGGSGSTAGHSANQNMPGSFKPSNMHFSQSVGPAHDKPEASLSLPDPGDWDPNYRQNGPIQAFTHMEVGSPPSAHDMHAGYGRSVSKHSHFMPHTSQNSPSRLGQQSLPRFNHGRPAVRGGEWNQIKVQPPQSSFNSGGPLSPGNSSLNNGMPWGRRANYPVTSTPSSSRGRKDHGRIA